MFLIRSTDWLCLQLQTWNLKFFRSTYNFPHVRIRIIPQIPFLLPRNYFQFFQFSRYFWPDFNVYSDKIKSFQNWSVTLCQLDKEIKDLFIIITNYSNLALFYMCWFLYSGGRNQFTSLIENRCTSCFIVYCIKDNSIAGNNWSRYQAYLVKIWAEINNKWSGDWSGLWMVGDKARVLLTCDYWLHQLLFSFHY